MDLNQDIWFRFRLRNILKAVVHSLPKKVRDPIYRRLIHLDFSPPGQLVLKLAQTQNELEQAFRLLHDEYVRAGLMKPHPSGMRITPYHALPSTSTLIALWDNEVVGTLSIIRESAFGFPMDRIFDTQNLKNNGARLAEISALAIKKNHRQNRGHILFPLLKFVYEYCMKYFGVDYMVVACHPKHIEFYESIIGFERFGDKIDNYDFVNNAPVVGGFLELKSAYQKQVNNYGLKKSSKNFFHYVFENNLKNIQYPDRQYFKIDDPILTPELLEFFFSQKCDVLNSLSDRDKAILRSLYKKPDYLEVLPTPQTDHSKGLIRSQLRYDVKCRGRICFGAKEIPIRVRDVSLNGIQAFVEGSLSSGKKVTIDVIISDFSVASLQGWAVWRKEDNVCGFYVESSSPNWHRFIHYLAKDLTPENRFQEAA